MNNKLTIKSLTPANPDWWAKFYDNNEDKTEWYSPVAAWALCDVRYEKESKTYTQILPVLTGEFGMEPLHPDEAYSEILYLPNDKFVRMGGECVFAWQLLNEVTIND
ncbi:hypothetical protein AB7W97_11470 [Providencia rettgeri]|uniref:hypothetical protein n=1 Tax=unclassified Providencia TaxID=2633465 RepID=UPI0012B646C2|nr:MULTISPECIES: hypothetical protein [Providencia]MTC83612.1 hypothetical protein [Providencia stuartii]